MPEVSGPAMKHVSDICHRYEKEGSSKWHREGRLALYKMVNAFGLCLGAVAQQHAEENKRGTIMPRDIHAALEKSMHMPQISADIKDLVQRVGGDVKRLKFRRGGGAAAEPRPKRANSAFFMFMVDQRDVIAEKEGLSGIGPIGRRLGELWREMTEEDKKPYEEKAAEDKKRYEKDMELFSKGLWVAPKKTTEERTTADSSTPVTGMKRPREEDDEDSVSSLLKLGKDEGDDMELHEAEHAAADGQAETQLGVLSEDREGVKDDTVLESVAVDGITAAGPAAAAAAAAPPPADVDGESNADSEDRGGAESDDDMGDM